MTTQLENQTLLRGVEVWLPSSEGDRLECSSHTGTPRGPLWGDSSDATAIAWRERKPTLGEQADTHEPTKVVALPAFRNETCRGVLSLLFHETEGGQGAVEVWRPNDRSELSRGESWCLGLPRFAAISEYVKFPRRAGLPGKVWADRFPRVMGSLGTSPDFVRSAGAKAEGLSTALGVPFMSGPLQLESVLVLLSSSSAPLAKAMEVWSRDPESQELKIVSADYGPYIDLAPISRKQRGHLGDGIAGHVYRDHAPWLTTDLLGVEFPRGEMLQEYGFSTGVGFPVFVGDQLIAAVTLLS